MISKTDRLRILAEASNDPTAFRRNDQEEKKLAACSRTAEYQQDQRS